jgi:hypothetical protein
MLINLWVKDKGNGTVHQVGTDVHDSIIFLDGQAVYYNLQNGCGTFDEYELVEPPYLDDYVSVTPDELYLNRKLIHEELLKIIERKKEE